MFKSNNIVHSNIDIYCQLEKEKEHYEYRTSSILYSYNFDSCSIGLSHELSVLRVQISYVLGSFAGILLVSV